MMEIILKITTACNFNCVYCSQGDGNKLPQEMPIEIYRRVIENLPEFLYKHGLKRVNLLFHGGEPLLLGKEKLARYLHIAKERAAADGYEIGFFMQTNGYLLDDDFIAILKEYNVGVGVSLDGYKELHDANRPTRSGEPSFDCVVANLAKLRAAGISGSILMVLDTAAPVDASKLLDFLSENKLAAKIHPVIACGRAARQGEAEILAKYENYLSLLREIFVLGLEREGLLPIEPLDSLMAAIIYDRPLSECSFNGSCARDFLCVYTDGSVGFCGREAGSETLVYGNLQKTSLTELYESTAARKIRARQEILKNGLCRDCLEWPLCRGGCSFEAVNAAGTLDARYPFCKLRQEFLRYLKTSGIKLIKAKLLADKQKYRTSIAEKKRLLAEVDKLNLCEITT